MAGKASRNARRLKRHQRVRNKVFGTPEKPRMCVFRSAKNISVQIIDDTKGHTLVAASSTDKDLKTFTRDIPAGYYLRPIPQGQLYGMEIFHLKEA